MPIRSVDMPTDVTQLLNRIELGDSKAAGQLLPLVYEELRRLAAAKMAREKPGQTLQATALVHEAWIKLSGGKAQSWNDRQHFFRAAAEAMRRILVDRARQRLAAKRGGQPIRTELTDSKHAFIALDDVQILALNEALEVLKTRDPQAAELVRLRYFAGLKMADAAELVGLPARTAERNWAHTKAWLRKEMDR